MKHENELVNIMPLEKDKFYYALTGKGGRLVFIHDEPMVFEEKEGAVAAAKLYVYSHALAKGEVLNKIIINYRNSN